ncbi:hypothetical protein PG985_006728 [Apiospora marii]|uniref:Uncharacterized protein n=1 Tax=Apiospora marii TaxID=335849 RepID=A0ABR1SG57_9PEZI
MEGADIIVKLTVTHTNVVDLDRIAGHTLSVSTAKVARPCQIGEGCNAARLAVALKTRTARTIPQGSMRRHFVERVDDSPTPPFTTKLEIRSVLLACSPIDGRDAKPGPGFRRRADHGGQNQAWGRDDFWDDSPRH